MAQTDGPCSRANAWAKLSGSALTMKFTSPWRNSETSLERCRAILTKPSRSNSRPNSAVSGAVYSTNSNPSVPIGLSQRSIRAVGAGASGDMACPFDRNRYGDSMLVTNETHSQPASSDPGTLARGRDDPRRTRPDPDAARRQFG